MSQPAAYAGAALATGPVRLHARRVAAAATLLALVLYVIVCVVADLVVLNHLYHGIDARLSTRLTELRRLTPAQLNAQRAVLDYSGTGVANRDLDDTPILVWVLPKGKSAATALTSGTPALPAADFSVIAPVSHRVANRGIRLAGVTSRAGRLIVGASTGPVDSLLATLAIIEAALSPIALLSLFVAATVIGRRAAMPIERMRVGQLDFTADASHELRTPLSVIEAEVGLALSSSRSADDYREALERIAHESGRLRDIVDDLLWLARVDSLPHEPVREPVDVAELVRSCAERFQPVAAQRGISLVINADFETSIVVFAPADWLDRLVSVLLDNACRYSRSSGKIEVSVETDDEYVTLFVDDEGPGFNPEERLALLERFHRASDVPGGAGLGLAIANAVVQATDGRLELGRAPSGGARVAASWRRYDTDHHGETSPQWPRHRSKVRPV